MPQRPVELILARQLASSLSVPVLLIDSKGDTLYFNEAAEELVGRRFDEIDALPIEERTALLAPSDRRGRPMAPELMPGMVAMREGRPVHAELSIATPDRGMRPIEVTAVPLQGVDDIVVGAWVVIWLTERPPVAAGATGSR
jgi:PAS domain-containing protein